MLTEFHAKKHPVEVDVGWDKLPLVSVVEAGSCHDHSNILLFFPGNSSPHDSQIGPA